MGSNEPMISMFGLDYCACTLEKAAQLIIEAAEARKKGLVVTPNVDHVMTMQEDVEMLELYRLAMYRFADGMPLVWFSRFFRGKGLPERVAGSDLLPAVARITATRGLKLFLLGGLPGVAEQAAIRLAQQNPSLSVAGTYSPPFGFEKDELESKRIVKMVNDSGADILFIGVGAPKQEKWAAKYMDKLDVGPILGVGAAFDFAAGAVKRAPVWLQRIGMEWLWRLLQEPGRLWRRYILKDSQFILLVMRELLQGTKS
ncbi:MAG TPA: WecB/TagA/CpsF family glycosyltransferase [Burkholderiales bacterium]|nr:WecB/TagA/CpsF family glycosyltransferase [Burkholderiales bacterium]